MIMYLEEPHMITITSNLRAIMEAKKITIRAMEEHTGLSNVTILKARRKGITSCRLGVLQIMAEYLGVKTKDLYDESEA
jgi:transcriptional regulator with XRE-family HTH domain